MTFDDWLNGLMADSSNPCGIEKHRGLLRESWDAARAHPGLTYASYQEDRRNARDPVLQCYGVVPTPTESGV